MTPALSHLARTVSLMRLTWVEGDDGVSRCYLGGSAIPVAEVRHNGRPAPLYQDRWIASIDGEQVGSSHHRRLAQELAVRHLRAR